MTVQKQLKSAGFSFEVTLLFAFFFVLLFVAAPARAQALSSDISLNWTAPSERVDGSPLGELDAYQLTCDGGISETIAAPATSASFTYGLAPGTYNCELVAVDPFGNESAPATASFVVSGVDLPAPQPPVNLTITVTVTVSIQ